MRLMVQYNLEAIHPPVLSPELRTRQKGDLLHRLNDLLNLDSPNVSQVETVLTALRTLLVSQRTQDVASQHPASHEVPKALTVLPQPAVKRVDQATRQSPPRSSEPTRVARRVVKDHVQVSTMQAELMKIFNDHPPGSGYLEVSLARQELVDLMNPLIKELVKRWCEKAVDQSLAKKFREVAIEAVMEAYKYFEAYQHRSLQLYLRLNIINALIKYCTENEIPFITAQDMDDGVVEVY